MSLSVTKTFGSDSATAGGAGETFTVSVHNAGVSDADNVSLTDAVDSRLIVDSIDAGDFTCAAPSQSISCSLMHLAAGATKSITVHYHVASTTNSDPAVDNTAHASSEENTAPASTDDVAIVENVVLSVAKTFNSASATAGGAGETFTVSVHNAGVSDADNVHLTDTVDSRLIVDSIDPSAYNCSATVGQSVDCSLLHLAAGGTQSITVHYHVATTTDSASNVSNQATAESDENGPTSGTDTVDIVENVDLSVTKAFDSASVTAGGSNETFTVHVTNNGVSNADNLHLTDLVDNRLIVASTAGDFACGAASQSLDCTLAHLGTGETATLVVTYHVATATEADPAVPNTAHAASAEDAANSNTANVAITENVNLVVTKHFADDSVDAGTFGHTFTITVQNTGVSQADNVSLNDTVDPRLHVTNVAGDFTCGAPSQSISCTLAHLNAGDTKAITVTYEVAASTAADPAVSNTANATADDGGAGSDTDSVGSRGTPNVANVKVDSPDPVIAGNQLTFTIHASNAGPSNAPNTTVHDMLDTQLTGATYCVDSGTGCVPGGAWGGMVNLGTFEPGDSADVVITATVTRTPRTATCSTTSPRSRPTRTTRFWRQHVVDHDDRRHRRLTCRSRRRLRRPRSRAIRPASTTC